MSKVAWGNLRQSAGVPWCRRRYWPACGWSRLYIESCRTQILHYLNVGPERVTGETLPLTRQRPMTGRKYTVGNKVSFRRDDKVINKKLGTFIF